jgi:hypothetical protein
MLLPHYQVQYGAFRQRLADFQDHWTAWSKADLDQAIAQLQQDFQSQILTLDDAVLDPTIAYHVRSHQTEIHKQLQLLKMDLSFWHATRQPDKHAQRGSQIVERLTTLIRFVDSILCL